MDNGDWPGAEEVFAKVPDRVAHILVWLDGERVNSKAWLNPSNSPEIDSLAIEWLRALLHRITDQGFVKAMAADEWHERNDGAFQLWCRVVDLDPSIL